MALGIPQGIRQLRELHWRDLLEFHRPRWRELAPGRAARIALGVAAPLLIGLATGHVEAGIFAALGALPAGFVSFEGVSRSRFEAVLAASIGMAVSTFVGATMAGTGIFRALPVTLWAYFTGLSIALGKRGSVVVINWTVAMLIGLSIPMAPEAAAARAGLVLAGGLFQGVLVVISWAFRPGGEERKALADTYLVLAGYASSLATGRVEAPSPSAFPASEALGDPNPLIPTDVRAVYLDVLGEAARLRASLAAIATYVLDPTESESSRRFAQDVGSTLAELALGLGAPRRQWPRCVDETERRVGALDVPANARWRWAGEALLGQLRAVTRILAAAAQPGRRTSGAPALSRGSHPFGAALATLRANATLKTEAGRHALRLAVAAGVAELVGDAGRLQYGRWAVLTVLLVLKPDYASTVARSIQRAVGTLLGAAVALAFIGLVEPSWSGTSLAAVVVVAVAYVMFGSNYLVYSVFLTAFVVLLLDLLGLKPLAAAEGRLGATALGAAWGLVAYLVWPTWAGAAAPETFAVLIERLGGYLVSLVEQLAQPGRLDLERLRREQDAARHARSDAEAATERLSREPPHPPLTPELARNLLAVSARLARPLLAAQTLVEQPAGTPMPATAARLEALAGGFQTATRQIASALREQSPPGSLPPLRQLQIALTEQGQSDPSVALVTDALVDAVGALGALLNAPEGEGAASSATPDSAMTRSTG